AHISAMTTDQMAGFETQDLSAMTMTQSLAFNSDQIAAMTTHQTNALFVSTPTALDLDGTGIHTLSASQGTTFDLTGNGSTAQHGWVTGNTGLLAMVLK